MSYEDLLNKPLTPSTKPKEEQRANELSIPTKKSNYGELSEKLSASDKEMLGMVTNYDNIKKSIPKSPGDLKSEFDQADLLLSNKRPDAMASLNEKVKIERDKKPSNSQTQSKKSHYKVYR